MVVYGPNVENALKSMLQNRVTIFIDKKEWRGGKFLLFRQKCFNIELLFEGLSKNERFEIPIPFDVRVKGKTVTFDYTFKTLTRDDPKLLALIKKMRPTNKNRFFDSILTFECK